MSSSDTQPESATPTTEIVVVTGGRYRVEGNAKAVEQTILDAARGSLMQLAWFICADTGDHLAVNPQHVVALRGGGALSDG